MIFQKKQIKYYHLRVFGCQMNKSDAERIEAVMQRTGYSPTLDEKQADVIIAVACSVRQTAIDRVYGLIHRWQRLKSIKKETRNKKLETKKQRNCSIEQLRPILILTGCVLEFDRKRLAEKFDVILPITRIGELPRLVTSHWPLVTRDERQESKPSTSLKSGKTRKQNQLSIINYQLSNKNKISCNYLSITPKHHSKHQAFVPIMTGCESYCTYCVVPYVRGREISRPVEEVTREVRGLVKRGYKEITLLGENVNNYSFIKTKKHKNIKTTTTDFPALLRNLAKIPGDFWIRFVTSNPESFSDELIETVADEPKICNHLHIPFQAGSDGILKKMNRKYNKNEYLKLIKKIKKAIPDVALSTDVIVGFPGETTDDFNETAKLMREVKFDMAYIAQYSPRPGTAATRMKDDVGREEKKRREGILTDVLKRTALANNRRLVGKTVGVLVENEANKVNTIVNTVVNKSELELSENKLNKAEPRARHNKINKLLLGKTEGFKNVRFSGDEELVGEFVEVRITKASVWGLTGEIVDALAMFTDS